LVSCPLKRAKCYDLEKGWKQLHRNDINFSRGYLKRGFRINRNEKFLFFIITSGITREEVINNDIPFILVDDIILYTDQSVILSENFD
jgi:hypothetical protein